MVSYTRGEGRWPEAFWGHLRGVNTAFLGKPGVVFAGPRYEGSAYHWQPARSIDRIRLKVIKWKRSLASSGVVVSHDPLLAPARVSAEGRTVFDSG